MNISETAKERLAKISWLSQLGKSVDDGFYRVDDIGVFSKSLESDEWENVTLEARNEITGFLASKHSIVYQKWNLLAGEARDYVEGVILPLVPEVDGVSVNVLHANIKWDLVSYLMEDAYKDKLRFKLFFDGLITVYELGHMPCGWNGEWPKGNLVIY